MRLPTQPRQQAQNEPPQTVRVPIPTRVKNTYGNPIRVGLDSHTCWYSFPYVLVFISIRAGLDFHACWYRRQRLRLPTQPRQQARAFRTPNPGTPYGRGTPVRNFNKKPQPHMGEVPLYGVPGYNLDRGNNAVPQRAALAAACQLDLIAPPL